MRTARDLEAFRPPGGSLQLGFAAAGGAANWAVPGDVSLPQLKSSAPGGTLGSREASLAAVLAQVRGTSDAACPYTDVACADTSWRDAADAVVLLMLASSSGGRFCTGTLINTEHLAADADAHSARTTAFILTASHCRAFDTAADAASYSAVLGYQRPGCGGAAGSSASHDVAPAEQLAGLRVAWQDEASDVMLLAVDGAVPAEYHPFFLGWNASGWAPAAAAGTHATLSHPRGDVKKLSLSSGGLRHARFLFDGGGGTSGDSGPDAAGPDTHYQVRWTAGGTDAGSSGAPLLDASQRRVLGVLTGGEAATCRNTDYFGSLAAAWERGLWTVLSPSGPDVVTAMHGRRLQGSQQGLVVTPSAVAMQPCSSGGVGSAELLVRLAAPPAGGQQLLATCTVRAADARQGAVLGQLAVSPRQLVFDSSNWAEEQAVALRPRHNASWPADPLLFDVIVNLGGGGPDSTGGWQAVVPGSLVAGDASAGSSPEHPFLISGSEGLDYAADGVIWAPQPDAQVALEVQPGQPLSSLAGGHAAAHFFNFSSSLTVSLNVTACSPDAQLQVVLFDDGAAAWLSTAPCPRPSSPAAHRRAAGAPPDACLSTSAGSVGGCSGLQEVLLPGLDTRPPYTLALLPLPPAAPAPAPAASAAGPRPGWHIGGGSGPGRAAGAVRYEIHVAASQLEAVFAPGPSM